MNVKRTFFIGDEWLYYKIYCGPKTADVVLSEVIKPVSEKLQEEQQIDKWFFIRYHDPKNHIRVRFHLCDENSIVAVSTLLNRALQEYIEANLVWKVMCDTYQREIERYGTNTIELTENLFCNDSVLTAGIVSLIDGDEGEIVRWAVGLRSIDEFINDFGYSEDEKFELLTIMKESFEKEYRIDKSLKKQLSDKYRKETAFIAEVLNPNNDEQSEFKPIYDLIKNRSKQNHVVVGKLLELNNNNELKKPLNDLMWSYLHMLNNRLFKSKQRTHELVMYYYIHQFYRSKLARTGRKFK